MCPSQCLLHLQPPPAPSAASRALGKACAPPVPPALSTSPYQQRLEVACASRSPFPSLLSSAKALVQIRCADSPKPIGQFPQVLPWAPPVCHRLRRRPPGASSPWGCEASGGTRQQQHGRGQQEVPCTSPGSGSRSRFAEGSHAWPRVKSCGPRRSLGIPGKTGQGPKNPCVVITCLALPGRHSASGRPVS